MYNLTPEEQKELDQWTKENLEKGYIQPSQSPMASPFFYVKKKDGKLQDCWYLNEWTIKNAYHLPLILELMDKVQGAKYFTNLMSDGDIITFKLRMETKGKLHSKQTKASLNPLMFFGMCNSPATFQSMMDETFRDLIDGSIVNIYMDNIFIFAKDLKTLEKTQKKSSDVCKKITCTLNPRNANLPRPKLNG